MQCTWTARGSTGPALRVLGCAAAVRIAPTQGIFVLMRQAIAMKIVAIPQQKTALVPWGRATARPVLLVSPARQAMVAPMWTMVWSAQQVIAESQQRLLAELAMSSDDDNLFLTQDPLTPQLRFQ